MHMAIPNTYDRLYTYAVLHKQNFFLALSSTLNRSRSEWPLRHCVSLSFGTPSQWAVLDYGLCWGGLGVSSVRAYLRWSIFPCSARCQSHLGRASCTNSVSSNSIAKLQNVWYDSDQLKYSHGSKTVMETWVMSAVVNFSFLVLVSLRHSLDGVTTITQ